jgi:glutamine synthetase
LLFLSAVIRAVDEFSDLLRLTVASAGNDHRLGANEAPPAIVSIFLGDQLTNILLQLENGKPKGRKADEKVEIGVTSLPKLPKDSTDRNRTSPFAFTGNKFEFRMLGSSASIADTNTVLNTIVADVLMVFADRLEKAEDIQKEVSLIIKDTIKNHKRVIFNGNNYSEEWVEEAKRRGLLNIESTVESIPVLLDEKNVDVFERHNILKRIELESRSEILYDNYAKMINIEALTMLQMAKLQILPAAIDYAKQLADTINSIKNTGLAIDVSSEASILKELSPIIRAVTTSINDLRKATDAVSGVGTIEKQAEKFHAEVLPLMSELRIQCDKLELLVPSNNWPFPTYSELLFDF